jgi:hypothetical protein
MRATHPTTTPAEGRLLREGTLFAEYSVVRSSATRTWVAVGSVRNAMQPHVQPAWLLVGTGNSEADAVEDLRQHLVTEAMHRSGQA